MSVLAIASSTSDIDIPVHDADIFVPLNLLKASPRNARKTPHSPSTVEALAGSIKAKGVLQPPVVEIERDSQGTATGRYLVTIGEGRRQALRLLAKRKTIKRDHPVKVRVDDRNDAHEISLDENVTREAMHPADQFEAFKRVADEKGWGAEEIGARFGVSAHTVRQRLRLGAVAPELMTAYRGGDLTMDQLMAFAVSEDQDRQRQVFDDLGGYSSAYSIRRHMTEQKVRADDRRALFVGLEAYGAAGGGVLRDLFTEDGGGWLEDVALLDALTLERLAALAEETRRSEGWKWCEAHVDYPHGLGLGRIWPQSVERSEGELAQIAALSAEYDGIVDAASPDGLTDRDDARLAEIDKALQAFGPEVDYRTEDRARSGVMISLGHDGQPRFERGMVRAEDVVVEPVDMEEEADSDDLTGDDPDGAGSPEDETGKPLSDRLVMDLTAHRTAGLREALASDPTLGLTAVVHAFALQTFYSGHAGRSALQLSITPVDLERAAPGVSDSAASRAFAARGEAWGARLPQEAADLWTALVLLPGSDLLDLLAFCGARGLNAVRDPHNRRPATWAHVEQMATALSLDMTSTWTASAAAYFGRVSKPMILEAVTEARDATEAGRIAGFKKADMAEAAERLVADVGWLPALLRTTPRPDALDEGADTPSALLETTPGETDDQASVSGPSSLEQDADGPKDDPDAYVFTTA